MAIWTRYSRNVLLMNLLEHFILAVPIRGSEDTAAKLIVSATECAMHFTLSFRYIVQIAMYGFSLAELGIRTENSTRKGMFINSTDLTSVRALLAMDFPNEGLDRHSTV